MRPTKPTSLFTRFTKWTSRVTGNRVTFVLAVAIIVVWAVTGPFFKFSDTWQLVINTGTTIITFLMVFLIQSTQNRDTEAVQVKLDELIRVTKGAHLVLLDLEELDDKQLDRIRDVYEGLAGEARKKAMRGEDDTGTPDLGDEWMHEAIGVRKGKSRKK
ncbi:MAG: low affinity iron permease family protein [Acidobacteria bacterium]|nr:low affinity iron permease family protein [Acidobacteriota bacterium]